MRYEAQRMNASGTERKLTFVMDEVPGDEGADSDALDLIEIATALASRKRLIAMVTLAAALIGCAISFLMPNRYTASTKIMPPEQNQSSAAALLNSLGGGLGLIGAAAGKDLGLKSQSELYVGMLKTRTIADALIRRFDLQKAYGAKDMTAAREKLADETRIVSEKEGFISVAVEDKEKKRAVELANGYIEELRKLTKGLALTEASQRRLFYEQQLSQAKDDLANAEIELKAAQQKSGVIQLEAQAKAIIEEIGKARARVAAKRVELQTLRTFATDQSPQIITAQRELAAMQSELDRLEKQTGAPGSYEVSLKDVPSAGVEYIRATRDLKYREALFELLARQYEAARLDEAKNAAIVQVVEPAVEPDRKSSPHRTLMTVLFTFTGLFLACLIVTLREWVDRVQTDPARAAQLKDLRDAVLSK
jgi:uncharacterized protein involved in exopolysaccharide biosynthesis